MTDKIWKHHFNLQTNPSSTPVLSMSPSPPPLSTPLFNSCHLTRYGQFALSIIWFVLWSRSSSYHCTKRIFDAIYPTILSIVNVSITTGTFLPTYNHLTCPLLEKPSLNKEDLSNYRRIANLSFISKLTEKIVKILIFYHLTSNSLLNPFQSAYTKFCSTETILLSLDGHLSNAVSMQQLSCLCLLGRSASFDALDHSILIHCLSTWFGVSSLSLQ